MAHIIGTDGPDTIDGSAGNAWIEAGGGDDLIYGGPNDTLDGGAGVNTVSYIKATAGVSVYLSGTPDQNTGAAAGDHFTSIQNVIGTNYDDAIYGNDGDNVLMGMGGNDTLYGGGGHNTLDGGAGDDNLVGGPGVDYFIGGPGDDIASYQLAPAGVVASLADPSINTGWAAGDTYDSSLENLTGSTFGDKLYAGDAPAQLWGLDGNDTLIGGKGYDVIIGDKGADYMDGGPGGNFLDYETAGPEGVTVDLMDPSVNTGDAKGDVYFNFRDLGGSFAGNDILWGDNNANNILGLTGDDQLHGRGGDDILTGGPGADTLDGGDGFDWANYSQTSSLQALSVVINLADPSATPKFVDGHANDAYGDVYISIEGIIGSSGNDLIILGSTGMTVQSGDGADTLYGGSAYDHLYGQNGDDILIGGGGSGDYLDGGAGSDTASYVNAPTAVYADLAQSADNTGDAAGDVYVSIENLTGSAYADVLRGDAGDNVLRGGGGGDTLYGGAGSDTFVMDSLTQRVTVLDFHPGVDKIGLDHTVFGLSGPGSLSALGINFVVGTAATSAAKTVLYDPSSGLISYDADGTGSGAAVVIGRIDASGSLPVATVDLPTRSVGTGGPGLLDSNWTVVSQGDFNGDGQQDLLWQNASTGALQEWFLSSGQWLRSASPGGHGTFRVAAVGDFNHDGVSDILWRDPTSGQLDGWLLNTNGTYASGFAPSNPGSGWSLAGSGDFNHDGYTDLLWRNATTGAAQVDYVGATGVNTVGTTSSQTLMTRDSSWSIAAVGDFNADGYADIVWRHSTDGQIDVSLQKNGSVFNTYTLGVHGTDWQVVGAGDFNFDLTSDLVFRNTTTGAVDGWLVSNQGYWEGSFSPGIHGPDWTPVAFSDFNGDGSTDFLWRQNSTGAMDGWHVLNGIWAGSFDPSKHGSDWVLAGTGDFNGDGVTDQFWYNTYSGAVQGYYLKNGSVDSTFNPGAHGTPGDVNGTWTIVGAGDFNGDGTTDLLWRNSLNGALDGWIIKQGNYMGSFQPAPVTGGLGVDWTVAGIGDFNGDGASDILWRNKLTGAVQTWLVKDGHWIGTQSPGTYNLDWDVAGVGDFNGDGVTDVLWRNHNTGQVDGWFLSNQGYWAGSFNAGSHTLDWTIAGVGDFNNDGTSDVLWQNTHNGQLDGWYVHAGHWIGSFSPASVPLGWQLAGIGDFNADGTTDLSWLDPTTGQIHNWLLTPPGAAPHGGDFVVV